jgi:hypothetical protein
MLRFCGTLLLAGVVLAGAIVAAWLLWGAPFDHAVININGDEFSLAQLHGGHGLAAVGGLAVGLLVVLLVVPVAVIVPLLIVALVLVVVSRCWPAWRRWCSRRCSCSPPWCG